MMSYALPTLLPLTGTNQNSLGRSVAVNSVRSISISLISRPISRSTNGCWLLWRQGSVAQSSLPSAHRIRIFPPPASCDRWNLQAPRQSIGIQGVACTRSYWNVVQRWLRRLRLRSGPCLLGGVNPGSTLCLFDIRIGGVAFLQNACSGNTRIVKNGHSRYLEISR